MSLSSLSLGRQRMTKAMTMQRREDKKDKPTEKTREKTEKAKMAAAKVRRRGTAEACTLMLAVEVPDDFIGSMGSKVG